MPWRIVRDLGKSYETTLCFNVNHPTDLPLWLSEEDRNKETYKNEGWQPFEFLKSEDAAKGANRFDGAIIKWVPNLAQDQRQPDVNKVSTGNGSDTSTPELQEAAQQGKHHYLVRITTDIPLDNPTDMIASAIMGCEEVARHYLFEHTTQIELVGIRHDN